MKKYELIEDTKTIEVDNVIHVLHRIRATRDFTLAIDMEVHVGDLGGWIEHEDNLSHDNSAWVLDESLVFGEARVFDDAVVCLGARVFGEAEVFNEAQVCGKVEIYDNARIYDKAKVFDNAKVYGFAQVHDEAIVSQSAKVYGKAEVFGNAFVGDDAQVSDSAWIYGMARVYGESHVCGTAWVHDVAKVYGKAHVEDSAWVNGHAEIGGDALVYQSSDYIVHKNSWSSWRWFTYTRSNKMWRVGCFYGTGKELIAKAYKDSELSGKCYEAVVRAQAAIDKALDEE